MAMRFEAKVGEEVQPDTVNLQTLLDLVKHEDASRIRGDLLNHANSRSCSLIVWGPESFKTKASLIHEFYNRAHQDSHLWRIVCPCRLEFNSPMDGGLVLEFQCHKDQYPRYVGYSVNM